MTGGLLPTHLGTAAAQAGALGKLSAFPSPGVKGNGQLVPRTRRFLAGKLFEE